MWLSADLNEKENAYILIVKNGVFTSVFEKWMF